MFYQRLTPIKKDRKTSPNLRKQILIVAIKRIAVREQGGCILRGVMK